MKEKENQIGGYQVRTGQYSKVNTRDQARKNEERYELLAQKRCEFPSPNRYTKTALPEDHSRFDTAEWTHKYDQTRQISNLNRSMGKESNQASTNIINKREVSRKQELEMRMNNINNINNKINNLLNLVKKERVYYSKQKGEDVTHKNINRSPSAAYRNKIGTSQEEKEEKKDAVVQQQKQQEFEYAKNNNKVLQRLRVLSTLEPNLINRSSSKSKQYNKTSPKQQNNQEDLGYERIESAKSNYSGCKNNQTSSIDQLRKYYPYEQKSLEPLQARYSKYSPPVQKIRQNGVISQKDINLRKFTPTRYQKMDNPRNEQQNIQSNPSRPNFSSNYVPITMIPNQKHGSPEGKGRYNQAYLGLKTVQNQIKRIKQRMGDSYSPQINKQRNQFNIQTNNFTPSRRQAQGKSDNTKNMNSGKKFELKVYPVKNDMPQTIKIAEKLCYQIEMDARMKKSREAFSRIEGEDKWKELSDKVTKHGIRVNANELKTLLSTPFQKLAQFHTEQSSSRKIDLLAQELADAQRFWEKHVVGCANLKALRREGFDSKSLDSQRNGHLKIQDILEFVNQYTAHSYNSVDIGMVFRRLQVLQGQTNSQKVDYSTFMRAFTM